MAYKLLDKAASCYSGLGVTGRPLQLLEWTGERFIMVANNIEDTGMHWRVISNDLTNQILS